MVNGFNSPKAQGYKDYNEIFLDIDKFSFPIIVKPVDSSGSKGVTVLYSASGLSSAVDLALSFSRSKRFVVEEYIEKKHPYLIGGDIFVSEGEIIQWGLLDCHRDEMNNPLVPVGKSYPPTLSEPDLESIKRTLRRIVRKLNIEFGAMNVELIVDKNNRVYPIDIGPRSGGNMIPDLLGMIFGCDVVEMTIQSVMGVKFKAFINPKNSFFSTYNLHTSSDGIYDGLYFSQEIEPYVIRKDLYVKKGDVVHRFNNASNAIGIVFFRFLDYETMYNLWKNIQVHVKVLLV